MRMMTIYGVDVDDGGDDDFDRAVYVDDDADDDGDDANERKMLMRER